MSVEQDKIVENLNGAVDEVRTDIARVEFWASALSIFEAAIPEFDLDAQRKQLPHSIWLPQSKCCYCASPIVSAIVAPRRPSGLGAPEVESIAVWCSASALSSAPSSTITLESHSQI